jgi:hypothetical protein
MRLSRRLLLILLDNLLISETEPSHRRLPGAAGEYNSSIPKNAFTIQIEIRIQKKPYKIRQPVSRSALLFYTRACYKQKSQKQSTKSCLTIVKQN